MNHYYTFINTKAYIHTNRYTKFSVKLLDMCFIYITYIYLERYISNLYIKIIISVYNYKLYA